MDETPRRADWYYTPEGRLRWHDGTAWTHHYLEVSEAARFDGRPPPPRTMLDEVRGEQARAALHPPRVPWWRRMTGRR